MTPTDARVPLVALALILGCGGASGGRDGGPLGGDSGPVVNPDGSSPGDSATPGVDVGPPTIGDSGVTLLDGGPSGTCAEPAIASGPTAADNYMDAVRGNMAGTALFRRVSGGPFTTPAANGSAGRGSDGLAIVDLDMDGRPDLVAVRNIPGRGQFTILLFRNLGCLGFEQIVLQPPTMGRLDVPTVADFDGDGMLDFYLATDGASRLLVARGSRTSFTDVSMAMGVQNASAYNHGAVAVADLDQDGFLDFIVGANQIGNGTNRAGTRSDRALRRVYLYRPGAAGTPWERGRYVDASTAARGAIPGLANLGGGDLFPDLMMSADSAKTVVANTCDPLLDRSGPLPLLRDLDDDGDLDLVMGASNDMFGGRMMNGCGTGDWRHGLFAWESRATAGNPQYRLIAEGETGRFAGLVQVGRVTYSAARRAWDVDPAFGAAFSPLSTNAADVDNDGDLDILGLTPTDPSWHVQSVMEAGRLWRNDGATGFSDATLSAGLMQLNMTTGQVGQFFNGPIPTTSMLVDSACRVSDSDTCDTMVPGDYQMMLGGGSIFADFNNDGFVDLHVVDRHDAAIDTIRNLIFMNDGDGTFTLLTGELSGIDATGIGADARDLDGDGRLEIVTIERSSLSNPMENGNYPTTDRIYWNTGAMGGRTNHWVELHFTGASYAALVGARVYLQSGATNLGRRDLFASQGTYKTSQDLFAHFGLGTNTTASVRIVMYRPGMPAREINIASLPIDRRVMIDVSTGSATVMN